MWIRLLFGLIIIIVDLTNEAQMHKLHAATRVIAREKERKNCLLKPKDGNDVKSRSKIYLSIFILQLHLSLRYCNNEYLNTESLTRDQKDLDRSGRHSTCRLLI